MGIFKRLFGGFQKSKMKILFVGLDNSGKTTVMQVMKPKKASLETVPTVGFVEETFTKNSIQFSAVDMSGQGTNLYFKNIIERNAPRYFY